MSNTKTVMGQASNQYVAPLQLEDVFSTYLYDGTGSAQTITNGIDLDGEGGLVWIRDRGVANHGLFDTERGVNEVLSSNQTIASTSTANSLTSFNADGFSIGSNTSYVNNNGADIASWTFRKAPKFFTCLTYTGTGSAQNISHNLGSVPGMIIVKKTNSTGNWPVYHRGMTSALYGMNLNSTLAEFDADSYWDSTDPTDSVFTVGNNANVNASGNTYVAYLFAHNDGDGGFNGGDIIKCGSYTGNGSTNGPEIDLGFEPQWVLLKGASASSSWLLYDVMRGLTVGTTNAGADQLLQPYTSNAEYTDYHLSPTSTGFKVRDTGGDTNTSGNTYIYIAIRRGTKVPESATEVFNIDTANSTGNAPPVWNSGFPVDMAFYNVVTGGDKTVLSRMTGGQYLKLNDTNAEAFDDDGWDFMDGWYDGSFTNSNFYSWMWKRAPGFFDAVAYTGTGSVMTVSHNLGVAPEMMWVKCRSNTKDWAVYHSDVGSTSELRLNDSNPSFGTTAWNNTAPTDSVFTLGVLGRVNSAVSEDYIAYLFASLPGISKVGSYTGTGATLNIDCGFTSGARFVLIKRTNDTNEWTLFDTARGIVAGNDPYLYLSNTNAEVNAADFINPYPQGFSLTGVSTLTNELGDSYIFYAIA